MKKSRFTDSQILGILKQAEAGVSVPELCLEFICIGAALYLTHSSSVSTLSCVY